MKDMKQSSQILFAVALLLATACNKPEHRQASEYVDHRSHDVDSLEQVLATNPPEGEDLLQVYFSLASGYVEINNEKARLYARHGITLADSLKQPEKSSTLYLYMGNTYYDINRYDSAMIYDDIL
ncbi:hypothetical protein FACS189413_15230 [Bacteroidia bacterium]|nr:hypothetical protein FACS189413_15230 [Bacteroidia bacterium]